MQNFTNLPLPAWVQPHAPLSAAPQNGGEPADLSFLAYLDVWLIGGLVLLAVVVVVGKLVWNRLRRRNDDDDDLYYDDYYYDDEYIVDEDHPDER